MWYAYHLLVALSALLLFAMSAALVLLIGKDAHAVAHDFFFSPVTADVLQKVAPLLAACLVSAFLLWFAMLRHYFENRSTIARSWLFWLIACNWGAAIAYFIRVWRPRNPHVST
jgi:hypothetical protein